MPTDKDKLMNIVEYCQDCKKETLQLFNREKKSIQCLECEKVEDISNKHVYPVWGDPAD